MSVFQEPIWALWISHGRHLQPSIKHADTLPGVFPAPLKNWSKLIELQGPVSLHNLLLCCSALTEAAKPSPVKTLSEKCKNAPPSCPWLCTLEGPCSTWMMCGMCPPCSPTAAGSPAFPVPSPPAAALKLQEYLANSLNGGIGLLEKMGCYLAE